MRKTIYSRQQAVLLRLLIDLRRLSGVSQTSLAAELGISQSEVSKHERGERGLDLLQLRHWLNALAMPLEVFIEIFEGELSAQHETLSQVGGLPRMTRNSESVVEQRSLENQGQTRRVATPRKIK